MKTFALKQIALAAAACVAAISVARADTLINSFDTPFNYVANGIVGDTNWDGVYLRFGDVPGGNQGTSGAGNTPIAGTAVAPFETLLALRNQGGNWTGAENDGFFLYKVVQGDFDVSVESVPGALNGGTGFDNRGNHLTGLMIRSYHTNNSGAPYSTTVTNSVENNVRLWRFNEFNIDGQVRIATNAANIELNFDVSAGNNIATNDSRWFRIVRTDGTNFSFYRKTNSFDSWVVITNANPLLTNGILTRADWAGQPLQVGICQAAFSTATRDAFFDNFELSGANVTFPPMTAPPTALVTTATNIGGSLTLSWQTNGCFCGENYLVVMSTRPIQYNPVQGVTYNSSNAYGTASARIGGAGQYVVYNGPDASVTVTNLGANNLTYYAAVFSYVTNSPPVYNTASPATNSFVGPGVITGTTLTAVTNNIPINGAVVLRLTASFSTGESSEQTANAIWSSGDPAIANANAVGTVSGISNGVATITATFGVFTPSTNITVHSIVFSDNFTRTNDYIANGLMGTPYDGLFLKFGDLPGGVAGGDGPGATITMDSQITTTNGLYMSSVQSDWEGSPDDGPFLYRVVPGANNGVSGDFQAVVHINTMNTLNGVVAGIQARLFNAANHGRGPTGRESHVNFWKVQNGTPSVRTTFGNTATTVIAGPSAADGWLLIQRVGSTNFYFFEKATEGGLWTFVTSVVMVTASNNAPMEVGLAGQSTLGVNQTTVFDRFSLDAAGIDAGVSPPPPATNLTMTLNGNLSMTLTWVAESNGVPVQSIAVMRADAPVSAQPVYGATLTGNSVFGSGTDLGGGNYVVYVAPPSPSSSTNTVTVTGLAVGKTYYAAVYTFAVADGKAVFNNTNPPSASVLEGFLTGITTRVTPANGIPQGGIGKLQVIGEYNPGPVFVDNTAGAAFGSGDTSILKVLNGILTGITNGTATLTTSFGGFTIVQSQTVRSPVFTDEFDVNHDYVADGVAGTSWDGWYNPAVGTNPIPRSPYVPPAGSGTVTADANVSSNGLLTLVGAGDGWENAAAGGFFLFKYVPGDFQMAVKIHSLNIAGFNQPGVLARGYGVNTNGDIGTPLGTVVPNANGTNNLGEYWVSMSRFDEFNIGTYARRNLDSAVLQSTQIDQGDTNYWLLVFRSGGTEFDFYKRFAPTDPWVQVPNKTHYSITQFAGRPMQVGIMSGPFNGTGGTSGSYNTVRFDRFMLDITSGSPLAITSSGGNATVSWPPIPGTLQSTELLVPTSWQNVPGSPAIGTNGYSLTVPLGTTNTFYRLAQ